MRGSSFRTYVALFIAVFGWGSSFVATKIALESFSTFSLVFLRLATAAIIFLVLVLIRRVAWPSASDMGRLLLLSLCEPVLYFLLETEGLARTSASTGSLVIAAVPGFVALFATLFLKEKMRAVGWAGTALSILGVSLLVLTDPGAGYDDSSTLGNLMLLGASLSAAGYIVIARSLSGKTHPLQISLFQMTIGAFAFAPLFFVQTVNRGLPSVSPEAAGAFLFLSTVATVGAFLCYNYALSRMPAARAGVFLNGIPLVTVVVATLLLGERMTLAQIVAGLVIILGVTLAGMRRSSRASRKPPGL